MKRLCSTASALAALFTLIIGAIMHTNHVSPPDWIFAQQLPEPIPPGQERLWPMTTQLPQPPFTLDATARFSASSSPSASWGIILDVASIKFTDDGQFFAPDMPNPIWFYDLHGPGAFNQINLTVKQDWQAELRINGHLVWGGTLPAGLGTNRIWTLFAEGGIELPATFTWQRVVIYTTAVTE